MNVSVDQTKCETVGECVKICPEVFTFEAGSKKAKVITPRVPTRLQGKCREAAAACPVSAISITEMA